jgi:hypothetical protein
MMSDEFESLDKETLLDIHQQMDEVDTWRQPHLTDTDLVKSEVELLLSLKLEIWDTWNLEGEEEFSEFKKDFKELFEFGMLFRTSNKHKLFGDDTNSEKESFHKLLRSHVPIKKILYVKEQIGKLIDFKITKEKELIDFAKENCPSLAKTFPKLMEETVLYNIYRVSEFREIFYNMLENIKKVQQGEITQKECTDIILNQDLSSRFYKRTD